MFRALSIGLLAAVLTAPAFAYTEVKEQMLIGSNDLNFPKATYFYVAETDLCFMVIGSKVYRDNQLSSIVIVPTNVPCNPKVMAIAIKK